MLQISALELAELLSGIARAQSAVVNGIDSAMAGSRTQHILPALQNAAHLRDRPNPSLADLPLRVLLSYQGRAGPDLAGIARDLERLCAGTAAAPAEEEGEALDFSTPPPAA